MQRAAEGRIVSGGNRRLGAIIALSVIGVGVSGYLTYVHYSNSSLLCTGAGGCETVNISKYAEIAGIPLALFGLGMYVAFLALSWARGWGGAGPWAALVLFGLSLAGTTYSGWLTYVELYKIKAVCPWCVTSAALVTFVLLLSTAELWRATAEEQD
ncbi:MAG: vitamin K epoxide reductase family protein [Chloroflexi bacterium]|nr:vitamin K epoxide reductase family protein [Chloroflexota bacterium]